MFHLQRNRTKLVIITLEIHIICVSVCEPLIKMFGIKV